MNCKHTSAYLVAFLVLAMEPVWADVTGSISGRVFDEIGEPVPDALVRVFGELLPAGRNAVTGPQGQYRFDRLLPGTYTVETSKQGLGTSSRVAVVEVDKTTQVDMVLGLTVEEAVTVTASTPVVDMKTTEVNFNVTEEEIARLPLERTYRGLFQLIPGVAENRTADTDTMPPAAGGSRQDNTFLVDGVNITNPGFGYLGTEVNELDIAEFNVKRAGISAEFGRSSGFVANAVTRSGTNDIHGSFRMELIPRAWIAESKDPDIKNTRDRWVPAFAIGGPFVPDKLFWFGSGRFYRSTNGDRSNNFGDLPDEETSINEIHVKVTAQPTSRHSVSGSYRHRPLETKFAGIGVNDAPEVATDNEGTNRIATATWTWFPTEETVFDARYLHLDEENEAVAVTDLGFKPSFDPNNLAAMGEYFDPVLNATVGGNYLRLNRQNYKRDQIKAIVTRYLDLGNTSHQIKAGFDWDETQEDLKRIANGWGLIAEVQAGTQFRGRYYPEQPSQLSKGRTYGIFVQDSMTIGDRMTLNLGVLFNRDEFAQEIETKNTFLTFGFFDEVQPRLGINVNLREGFDDKLYANWGRYYNLDQKSTSRSMAPGRLFTSDAIFDLQGNLLSDEPGANTVSKNIDPEVNPPYIDEFLMGYATSLGQVWALDAYFMYRNSNHFIEDQPQVLPASNFIYANLANGKRTYKAFTLLLERRFADRWSMSASYTWSRLAGNFDLDYNNAGSGTRDEAVFNTSSALQDGPGLFVEDEFREGPLSQDRTHLFKVFVTYLPVERFTLGGFFRVQSGTPWAAKGRDWYNGFRRYLEQAGGRRNDAWPNLDLLASYRFAVGSRAGLTVEGRLLNVFNTQTALFRDQRQYLDGRIRNFSEPPYLVQGTSLPNEEFGDPTEFAPAQRFLLTFLFDF